MTLLELAEACERADGADRSLDGMITKELGEFPCWATIQNDRQPELFTDGKPGLRAREWLCPKYTGSLDAAMSLVPDGSSWEINFYNEIHCMIGGYQAIAATAALALTTAALRARHAMAMEKK